MSASLYDSSSASQSTAYASVMQTVTASIPVTHTVAVAKAGFTFQPDVTLADVGDYVEFQFYPTNHSVARAEYMYPCIPYEDTGVDKIGFFSGFQPVDAILADPPNYTLAVSDTNPIFYYCTAPGSCITYGMVGVINPNSTTSLALQRQLAHNSSLMLQPGESWPAEASPNTLTVVSAPMSTTVPVATATQASPSNTNSAAVAVDTANPSTLSGGAIAGIAIAGAVVVLLAAALVCILRRQANTIKRLPLPQLYPHGPFSYIPAPPEQKQVFNGDPRLSSLHSPPPGYYPWRNGPASETGNSVVYEMDQSCIRR